MRRLKSYRQPRKIKKLVKTAEQREEAKKRKLYYKKNRVKILKAAKIRERKKTSAEKAFDKKRAEYLKSTARNKVSKPSRVTRVLKR